MKNVDEVVGEPIQAGCTVTAKGRGKAIMTGAAAGQALGAIGRTTAQMASEKGGAGASPLPASAFSLGYLALTAGELVLVEGKQGLTKPKAVSVLARAPRSEVLSAALGDGKLTKPLVIAFRGDVTWEFEIPRVMWKDAEKVLTALA